MPSSSDTHPHLSPTAFFMGTRRVNLDAKRKLKAPAEWVGSIGEGAILTKNASGGAMLMPAAIWENFTAKLLTLPMSADPWKRIFLGGAEDASVDSRGRLSVSEGISAAIGVTTEVILVGVGRYIELWAPARLAAKEAQALAEPMPTSLASFTF